MNRRDEQPTGKPDIDNLYNCTYNKTRKVREYLQGLNYATRWDIKQKGAFDKAVKEALNATSATESLDMIGYQYKNNPTIYTKITNLGSIEQQQGR